MKIALINGRGREGAGVQKFANELHKYLVKQSIEHKFFVCEEKKWGRGNMQEFPEFKSITSKNMIGLEKELNTYDYICILAVPSVKHPQDCINNFFELIKKLTSIKIIFQNDHKIASIWRNANFLEICNICDGIVSHSIESPFYKKLITLYSDQIRSKFIQLHVGFEFEQLQRFRKKEHIKEIIYLGRYATFKQPDRLFGFLPYTKENDLLLTMKGIERSLGSLNIFYDNIEKRIPKHNIIEINKKTLGTIELDPAKRSREHIYIYGPYNYIDGMEAVSNSLVAADFYHLDAKAYGDNIEYAQCEIIACGCVGLFDAHWAENCHIYDNNGNNTNQRFIDTKDSFLFLKKDLSNIKEVIDKINDIWSNKLLHKTYLENGYEIMKAHCNSNWIFQKLIDNILQIKKTKVIKSKSLF